MITTGVRRSILERICQGDQTAIAALTKRFHSTEPIPKRVFQSLEKIGYGNAMAIATLASQNQQCWTKTFASVWRSLFQQRSGAIRMDKENLATSNEPGTRAALPRSLR